MQSGSRGKGASCAEFCRRLRFCLREFRAIASRLHGCMACMMQRKRTTATAGEAAAATPFLSPLTLPLLCGLVPAFVASVAHTDAERVHQGW